MKRSHVNRSRDRKYFTNTANKIKEMNLPKTGMRGGIRL